MPSPSSNSVHRGVLLLSIGLFLAACALPALVLHDRAYHDSEHQVWQSYHNIRGGALLVEGLLLGWLRMNFTAFANIPLWLGWIQFGRGRYKAARVLASVALVLSIETLQLTVQPYLYDEGGTLQGFLVAPHVGFFCWIGSMAAIWFGSNGELGRSEEAPDGPVRLDVDGFSGS